MRDIVLVDICNEETAGDGNLVPPSYTISKAETRRHNVTECLRTGKPDATRGSEPVLSVVKSHDNMDFTNTGYLVDPARSHMLVSRIKPCKCQSNYLY